MIFLKAFKAFTTIVTLPITIFTTIRDYFDTDRKERERWIAIKEHIDKIHEKVNQLKETAILYTNMGMLDESDACLTEAQRLLRDVRAILEAEHSKTGRKHGL